MERVRRSWLRLFYMQRASKSGGGLVLMELSHYVADSVRAVIWACAYTADEFNSVGASNTT